MGKIVLEKKKRKKKKGRPSLLDLQKRTLKQQQKLLKFHKKNKKPPNYPNPNPNPNSNSTTTPITTTTTTTASPARVGSSGRRRSTRRNPKSNSDEELSSSGVKRRREKKLNLINLGNDNIVISNNKKRRVNDEDDLKNDDDDDDDEEEEEEVEGSNLRKRKIHSISSGSGGVKDKIKGEKHSADATKQSSSTPQQGGGSNLDDDGPSTSLPDKSLLLFILDRLQKKDTYEVFSEPVDPEELPDYHEVIDHPMDFGTVRKKLDSGAYASLEEFEKDVFLICSNAMQYNAPDTVYFRQARSIQELAKKNFDNLRADSDDNNLGQEREPEPKVVRRGRPPTKNLKRTPGRPPLERATSNFSEATLAQTGSNANRSNNEVRKSSYSEKYGSSDSLARSLYGTRYGEAYFGWSAERQERADEILGSASKGFPMKFGKKHIMHDESRRNTYMYSCALASGQDSSVLSTFNRERKQLIAVGLHTEYGYARSLARFAAKIGPVAWKVASKKIERCLPAGVKFGPGWIGENEAPAERPIQQQSLASAGQQTPSSFPAPTNSASSPSGGPRDTNCDGSSQKPQGNQLPEMQKPCNDFEVKEESGDPLPPVADNDAAPVCSSTLPSNGAGPNIIAPEGSARSSPSTLVNISNDGSGSSRRCQTSAPQSRINGLNGSYGPNLVAHMGKIIGPGRPTMFNLQTNSSVVTVSKSETHSPRPSATTDNNCGQAKLGNNSTGKYIDCLPNTESSQNGAPTPPDLNVGFQSPGSPVSGKGEAVQPDLALQL